MDTTNNIIMKNIKFITGLVVCNILSINLLANANELKEEPKEINSIADAFLNGKVKGLLRYSGQYRDSKYHILQDDPSKPKKDVKVQSYSALGGYLGYETAPFKSFSLGATFYTSNPFLGENSDSRKGLGGLYEEDGGQDSYSVLGEAYLKYQNDEHRFVLGRQEMPSYRFISLTNVRMTPVIHEGVTYENTSIDGLKINTAFITGQKDRNSITFDGMIRASRVSLGEVKSEDGTVVRTQIRGSYNKENYDASGNYIGEEKSMPMIGLIYSKENFSLEAWDYYVDDFLNTAYFYGDYSFKIYENLKLSLSAQYGKQQDVGEHVAGNIDSWFYGARVKASINSGMNFFLAYNEVNYNENSYDSGTIFVRWGTPQMFNSFQIQDSELAGTKSVGVGAFFDLGALNVLDSTIVRVRYADYDLPDDINMLDARQDRTETTFELRYAFEKKSNFSLFSQIDGLSILFRLAYNKFSNDYDYESYKKEHDFSFSKVNDDFIDVRLYLDYVF